MSSPGASGMSGTTSEALPCGGEYYSVNLGLSKIIRGWRLTQIVIYKVNVMTLYLALNGFYKFRRGLGS
jgi:hypothetical protein